MTAPLKIAFIGTRGVPATFGGIERHVEEIGARLADRGHQVTVFSRRSYTGQVSEQSVRGMRVVALPSIGTKHLEALSHTALATAAALRRRHDIYHFHAVGPGLLTPLARVSRGGVVLTVHGLDFDRDKWSAMAQRLMMFSGRVGAAASHEIVVVAPGLVDQYQDRYGKEATFIRNGVTVPEATDGAERGGRFILSVGRLTPEKGTQLLVEAFRRLPDPDLRLVIVGGSSHTDDYVEQLQQAAHSDPRIELRGYVYGADLARLYAGARVFVQASKLEGMPLTLLEAASHDAPLVASDIPVHVEVLGGSTAGRRLFHNGSVDALEQALRSSLDSDHERELLAAREFGASVLRRYSWEDVVDELEQVYDRVGARRTQRVA